MLRRTQSIAFKEDNETMAASPRPVQRRGLSALRPELVSAETPPAPEPEAPSPRELREEEPLTAAQLEHRRNLERWRAEVLQSVTQGEPEDNDGGRFRQIARPRNIALLIVALIAGGTAAWLALQPAQPVPEGAVVAQVAPAAQPAPEPVVVKEPMVQVLVAKSPISVGQRLSAETIQWVDWPEAGLREEFITATALPDALTQMEGAVARYEFFPGEPIREAKLARSAEGLLSAVLDPGTRAVAVNVTAESASGGFIQPNDRVDVVLTTAAPGGAGAAQVSQTIVGNVRVLAINSQLGGEAEKPVKDGEDEDEAKSRTFASAIATLALDPRQAEVIISATMSGRLSLVLRPTADVAEVADSARTRAANQAIRISSPFWAR